MTGTAERCTIRRYRRKHVTGTAERCTIRRFRRKHVTGTAETFKKNLKSFYLIH